MARRRDFGRCQSLRGGRKGVACLLVVAVAGLARGAGAADDDVGGLGWAGAVGGVGWGGGADELVRAGVAVGGEVSLVGFGGGGGVEYKVT